MRHAYRPRTWVLLLLLPALALACSDGRRARGGGGGEGEGEGEGEADLGRDEPGACTLAEASVCNTEGCLLDPEAEFEDHLGQALRPRDDCGKVIWLQVGTEDT